MVDVRVHERTVFVQQLFAILLLCGLAGPDYDLSLSEFDIIRSLLSSIVSHQYTPHYSASQRGH